MMRMFLGDGEGKGKLLFKKVVVVKGDGKGERMEDGR